MARGPGRGVAAQRPSRTAQSPVPPHTDPGGLPVAIIDTGVNYLLPEINRRLARDPAGMLLGYDFWDLDERPFDVHPRRSAFYPDHHGTTIASIVLAEAPVARLLPYRYPRPDMSRLAMLVEHAASHGARIVNLSLTSFDRAEWAAFEQAATRHPEILFVVAAGNDNRDIDRCPVYPAALPLDNLITVTAARADGHLARGVNWGPRTVDLMVEADGVLALGFDGRLAPVSGRATPRRGSPRSRPACSRPAPAPRSRCCARRSSPWRRPPAPPATSPRASSPIGRAEPRRLLQRLPDLRRPERPRRRAGQLIRAWRSARAGDPGCRAAPARACARSARRARPPGRRRPCR